MRLAMVNVKTIRKYPVRRKVRSYEFHTATLSGPYFAVSRHRYRYTLSCGHTREQWTDFDAKRQPYKTMTCWKCAKEKAAKEEGEDEKPGP